jgi:hypothetical protein
MCYTGFDQNSDFLKNRQAQIAFLAFLKATNTTRT